MWILGDLFHAPSGVTSGLEASWRRWQAQDSGREVHLVVGNHDRHLADVAGRWGMTVHLEDGWVGGIPLRHHPPEPGDPGPLVVGHLHPVVRLREGRRSRLRIPCFWLRGDVLVLPALGEMVDGAAIRVASGDRVFVPAGDQVLEIPSAQLPSSERAG